MPEDIPAVKKAAIEGYGARLEIAGLTSTDRHRRALEISGENGSLIIPPFDHPDVIAGQGTTGLEIIDELPEADAILVPTGGGGLLAGVAIALSHRNPSTRVIGVEPADANAMALSVAARELVSLQEVPGTIADGLKPMAPGKRRSRRPSNTSTRSCWSMTIRSCRPSACCWSAPSSWSNPQERRASPPCSAAMSSRACALSSSLPAATRTCPSLDPAGNSGSLGFFTGPGFQ